MSDTQQFKEGDFVIVKNENNPITKYRARVDGKFQNGSLLVYYEGGGIRVFSADGKQVEGPFFLERESES